MTDLDWFRASHYQRHNARRLEHLATLGLPFHGKTVLEVGAGIGDHTGFLLDRSCAVTSTDGRGALLEILRSRYPNVQTLIWDVETPAPSILEPHDVSYVYGLLYHTKDPAFALAQMAELTSQFLVLETCVSFGEDEATNHVNEVLDDPTQALSGTGCRPTRAWVMSELRRHFEYAYLSRSQPWHEEFPLDWCHPEQHPEKTLARAVFVGSHFPMSEDKLSPDLLDIQFRC